MLYVIIGATIGILLEVLYNLHLNGMERDYLKVLNSRRVDSDSGFADIDFDRAVIEKPARIVVEPGDEVRCYRDADGYLRRTVVKSDKPDTYTATL